MIVHCITTLRHRKRQALFIERWHQLAAGVCFVYAPDVRDLPTLGHDRIFGLTCSLVGHLTIWEELVDKPGWHLIAEDDAMPLPNFKESCQLVLETPNDFQVVKLHHTAKPANEDSRLFAPPPEHWTSTVAYFVRDTRRLLGDVRFVGAPDRMLALIAKVGAVYPVAVAEDQVLSTMPQDFRFRLNRGGIA